MPIRQLWFADALEVLKTAFSDAELVYLQGQRSSKFIRKILAFVTGVAVVSVMAAAWGVIVLLTNRRLPSQERTSHATDESVKGPHLRHNRDVHVNNVNAPDQLKSF